MVKKYLENSWLIIVLSLILAFVIGFLLYSLWFYSHYECVQWLIRDDNWDCQIYTTKGYLNRTLEDTKYWKLETTTTIPEENENFTAINEDIVCVDVPCEGNTVCEEVTIIETNETYYTNCFVYPVGCMRCFNRNEVTIKEGVRR